MANQIPLTSCNHDSTEMLGLLDGEQYSLNGVNLTVNSDVRWGQNSAVIGNATISNTQGGKFLIDATATWEITFISSTGIAPVMSSLGSNIVIGMASGATGELLRVWGSDLTPLQPGAAIPQIGWIKLRSKTGSFTAGETITLPGGATIVATDSGKTSWIHVVGALNTRITVPRLGSFESRGNWYTIGMTSGSLGQTLQFPVSDMCPAIQIETAPGSGIFEWYLNGGARWATATQFISNDARGKYFGCSATGLISLAIANCGYLPPAGCKIRTPNIILGTASNANWNLPVIGISLAARWSLSTTGGGIVDLEQITGAGFLSITSAYYVRLVNSASFDQIPIASVSTAMNIDNIALGLSGSIDATTIQFTNCFAGGTISNVRAVAYASTSFGRSAVSFLDAAGFNLVDVQSEIFGSATAVTRGTGVNALSLQRCARFSVIRPVCIGARYTAAQVDLMTTTDMKYADCLMGSTQNVQSMYAVDWAASVYNSSLDGFSAFANISGVNPYNGIVNYATSRNLEFRNIGTPSNYYDAGNISGFLGSGNSASMTTFRRCYINNLRTAILQTFGNSSLQQLVNVHGDYTDGQAFGFTTLTAKGVRLTPTLSGQLVIYGTHWVDGFKSATAGFITVAANEPLSSTSSQCAITAGNPKFTSNGSLVMSSIGDQVTWTMPYSALGHTALTNFSINGSNTGNILFEFQVNTTGNYSAWVQLNSTNLLAVGAINPNIGVSLIIRATTITSNVNNILEFISIVTQTDAISQMIEYALPVESYTLTLSSFKPGTEVRIYRASDMIELSGVESITGDFVYEYPYLADLPVVIIAFALGWQVVRIDYTLKRSDTALPIQQTVDRNFYNT